jgi:hypothetical protein
MGVTLKLLLLIAVIGFAFPLIAQSQSCTIKKSENLIHIPQMHWGEGAQNNPGFAEMVAKSQFEVAQTLLSHPDRAVFMESRFETADRSDLPKRKSEIEEAKKLFPSGIPKLYSEMSDAQKRFLSTHHAVDTLYLLGKIRVINKTYSSKAQAQKYNAVLADIIAGFKKGELPDSDQVNSIYKQREESAVSEISKWQRNNPGKKAFIVYGTAHDFDKYYDREFARATCPNSEMPPSWSVTLKPGERKPASTN